MPRRPSRRSRLDDDDSESSLSLFCNSAGVENSDASFYSDLDSSDDSSSAEEVIIGDYSAGGASSGEEDGSVAWKEEESSSGEEEEGSSSSFSGEESSDLFSEKDSDVGSVHYLYPHSASYRENDSSSRSSDGSVSSLDGDDDEEKGSSDENSINEAAVGSAKRFYLDEKFRGSVLKEKKREHIPLLRAMAIGLDDGDRQDDRFNECVDNGFVKKADVQPLKRHLYAEAMRRSSGNLKALSSWKVKGLIDHLQNQQNRVEEEDEIWIVKKIDAALKKFEKSPRIRGPFECSVNDHEIFRGGKKDDRKKNKLDRDALYFHPQLQNGRKAVGDSGYSCRDLSDKMVTTRWIHSKQFKKWIARVKSRQETLFIRMKAFNLLGGVFRHSKGGTDVKIALHKACTEAVLTLVAYDLEEYPLFDVDRSDVSS